MSNYLVHFKLLTMPCDSTGIFFFKFMPDGTIFCLDGKIPLISPGGIWDLSSVPLRGCASLW